VKPGDIVRTIPEDFHIVAGWTVLCQDPPVDPLMLAAAVAGELEDRFRTVLLGTAVTSTGVAPVVYVASRSGAATVYIAYDGVYIAGEERTRALVAPVVRRVACG